ncbi:MAG: hypothetical protein JXM73_24345 [Anaerolineae bacterium]|nr:hypothetical protein [Anaerolineae bacterium]
MASYMVNLTCSKCCQIHIALGDRLIIWVLLVALAAIVIYTIGRLLGFW